MNMYYIFLLTVVMATVAAQQSQQPERQAIAVVSGPNGVSGNITFTQSQSRSVSVVAITGTVVGLTKGLHGFHIHEKGDLRNGCASTGSHFNPDKKNHGSPGDSDRHIGDLGNIEANEQGVATINIQDSNISLSNLKRNILGRAVVIHSDTDDLGKGGQTDSLTTGHAGSRVACGIIGTLTPYGKSTATATTVTQTLLAISIAFAMLN